MWSTHSESMSQTLLGLFLLMTENFVSILYSPSTIQALIDLVYRARPILSTCTTRGRKGLAKVTFGMQLIIKYGRCGPF